MVDTAETATAEQQARELLARIGVENAESFSAGDLVELAELIAIRQAITDRLHTTDEFVILPKNATLGQYIEATGTLLDVTWSAVDCFVARYECLARVAGVRLGKISSMVKKDTHELR